MERRRRARQAQTDRADEVQQTSGAEVDRWLMLTCTLAAMMWPFALFLVWAEKDDRRIRQYAVQSAALAAAQVLLAITLAVLHALIGGIPYLGFLVKLVSWIAYIVLVLLMIILRVRMMHEAWRGREFLLPVAGEWLSGKA